MLLHQSIIVGVAKSPDVLAALALMRIGKQQLLEDRRVGRIGDHRASDAASAGPFLPHQGDTPRNCATPVVADDGELVDAQLSRQQEDVADQLVRPVSFHFLRLGRPAVTALVGRDAAVPVRKVRDLVPPGTVAFGKAVEEHQRWSVLRTFVDHVQFDAVGKFHALLFHSQPSASIFSM